MTGELLGLHPAAAFRPRLRGLLGDQLFVVFRVFYVSGDHVSPRGPQAYNGNGVLSPVQDVFAF